ncbi:MAG: YceI family protein [Lutibacter sp.]|jgi:hypothetical protein|nr:YceI family protein [Lutibacter sp.]
MKTIKPISILLIGVLALISCKEIPKKEVTANAKYYVLEADSISVNWTAYKTTEKIPVKGTFQQVLLPQARKGQTPAEALDGTQFTIPISSLFTGDTGRDTKIKDFFFGVMKQTTSLKGNIRIINEASGTIDLTMNGLSNSFPFSYIVKENTLELKAQIDVEKWQALEALTSLNKVCELLHTGADGISKTWSEVAITARVHL